MADILQPPQQLANKVIKQMIEHLFANGFVVDKADYLAIRVVFRQLGGLWEALVDGDSTQIAILEKIVTSWGQQPGHKKPEDEAI